MSPRMARASDVAVTLKLRTDAGLLSFLSTTTIFGTAVEITLSELVLEAFYPADQATARHSPGPEISARQAGTGTAIGTGASTRSRWAMALA